MQLADVASPVFSWNLVADFQDMWSYAFMVNAFRAGLVVSVVCAVVGWFMVLRRQTFAGHTLSVAAFPGASLAVLAGFSTSLGYFGFCIAAALVIAALGRKGQGAARRSPRSPGPSKPSRWPAGSSSSASTRACWKGRPRCSSAASWASPPAR